MFGCVTKCEQFIEGYWDLKGFKSFLKGKNGLNEALKKGFSTLLVSPKCEFENLCRLMVKFSVGNHDIAGLLLSQFNWQLTAKLQSSARSLSKKNRHCNRQSKSCKTCKTAGNNKTVNSNIMTTRMTRICLLLRSNSNTKHKEKLVKNIPHVTLHCCLHKT